jgi:hypothetical protein
MVPGVSSSGVRFAAIVNLNRPAHTVHSHFFQMSVANVVVIVAMLLVFVAAIAVPFPGAVRGRKGKS